MGSLYIYIGERGLVREKGIGILALSYVCFAWGSEKRAPLLILILG